MKIKLGPEQMSVNGKNTVVMPTVLHIVSQYHAEIQEINNSYNATRNDLDARLRKGIEQINQRYEEMLLGVLHK